MHLDLHNLTINITSLVVYEICDFTYNNIWESFIDLIMKRL